MFDELIVTSLWGAVWGAVALLSVQFLRGFAIGAGPRLRLVADGLRQVWGRGPLEDAAGSLVFGSCIAAARALLILACVPVLVSRVAPATEFACLVIAGVLGLVAMIVVGLGVMRMLRSRAAGRYAPTFLGGAPRG